MSESIQKEIKTYYGSIAKRVTDNASSGCSCSTGCCKTSSGAQWLYGSEYLTGIPTEALEASLGCANPLVLAKLQPGERVLDLGSGGGIDVLMASRYVGENGWVYGLDMTDEMLELAAGNLQRSGAKNVSFIKGYIEDIPLEDEQVDVVTSNCVINLSVDKQKVLHEAHRVLKKGGRVAVADIVQLKPVSELIMKNVQMWVGCISGALTTETYIAYLEAAGFSDITIEPVNVYTKDMVKAMAKSKGLMDLYQTMDEAQLDGAFAGAHIRAVK